MSPRRDFSTAVVAPVSQERPAFPSGWTSSQLQFQRSMSSVQFGADGYTLPHGGKLVDLMVTDAAKKSELIAKCGGKKIVCSGRNACDVEVLVVGKRRPAGGIVRGGTGD